MPRSSLPPDPWLGSLLRRALFLGVLLLLLGRVGRPGPRSAPPDDAPDTASGRVLPLSALPLDLPGPGTLLAPFDVDDVDAGEAGWALLDRGAGSVLVLGPDGEPLRRVGRRGAGPGELERPLRVALGPEGAVAVLHASGQRLDVFPASGLPRRVPVDGHLCNGTFGDDVLFEAGAWWLIRRCFDGPDADLEVWRVPEGQPAERVDRRPLTRMNTDPFLVPLLAAVDGRVYAGSNRGPCLGSAEPGTAPDLCLPRPPEVPVPDSVAERLFGDLGRRAAAVGLDLRIPTHYPGVVGVARGGGHGIALRVVLADGSDAWAEPGGDSLRVARGDGGARPEPGVGRWLLLRDDAAGLRVWTVPPPPGP